MGFPVKDAVCFFDISLGADDIGFMEFFINDDCFFAEKLFDGVDDVIKGDGFLAATKVHDFVVERFFSEDGSAGDVVDVGEVAGLIAVAEEFDGLAFVYPFNEAEEAHVGPACWPVYGKVTDNGDV